MKRMLLAAIVAAATGIMPAANSGISMESFTASTPSPTATTLNEDTPTEEPSWVEVNLETAGSLGVEILYKVDALGEVQKLRINGPMNSVDWETIKNCGNIISLDMSYADCTSIPNEQFSGRSIFAEIILPKNLQVIGEYAFANTGLITVNIPASVTTIGKYAFAQDRSAKALSNVTFEEGSKLNSIGEYAFYYCTNLKAIELPDNISSIYRYTFGNSGLENIKLPSSLQYIGEEAFSYSHLIAVDFPETLSTIDANAFWECNLTSVVLPESVTSIGDYAFYRNSNLTDVELPSGLLAIANYAFAGCNNISNVVCHAALPPSCSNQRLPHTSDATLTVPSFSIVNYKLDSYWLGYSTIKGGADTDNYTINGTLSLTNDRRMDGTPSLTMNSGSTLVVGGTAAMPLKDLTLWCNFSDYNQDLHSHSKLINSSPAMTAESACLKIYLYGQKWHFISLPFNVKRSDITSDNASESFVIRYYDGASRANNDKASGNWQNVGDDDILMAGKGYIVQTSRNMTLTFPAMSGEKPMMFDPNEVSVPLDANSCENKANSGWNLIGNPHQSYYDMYYSMLTSPITVWDFTNSRYVAYSMIDDNVVLKPNQSFFIQADESLDAVKFSPAGRQISSTVSRPNPVHAAAHKSDRALYDIILTSASGEYDNTRVVINNNALEEYETSRDASKFFSDNDAMPMLYTIDADANSLAINERPDAPEGIRLCMIIPASGTYTISASRADGEIVLKDLETGKSTNLEQGGEYTFTVDEPCNLESRFVIYPTGKQQSGVDCKLSGSSLSVKVIDGGLAVSGASGKELVICSIDGMVIASGNVSAETVTYSLTPGLYIVKAGMDIVKCIVK